MQQVCLYGREDASNVNHEFSEGVTRAPGARGVGAILRSLTVARESDVDFHLQGDGAGLRQMFDALPVGVVLTDAGQPDLPIVFVNPAFLALTGYSYDDVVGRNCRFLQGPETNAAAVTTLREAIREGRQHSIILRNHHRDGSAFWNEVTVAPMYASTGEISHFLGVQNDVTARIAAEQERAMLLRRADEMRMHAEQDVHVHNKFLSATTHDLRTPLTTLRGRAQLVQRRLRRGQQVDASWLSEQMDAIITATKLMQDTIDELSDVARLQAGRTLELQIGVVDIGLLAKAVGDDLVVHHGRGTTRMSLPNAPAVVEGDRARLERVLQNVVGNAVKYSRENLPIDIIVETAGDRVLITVRDRGVGIPSDELLHIFEHYYRASTARGITGSGLGLAGARAIVAQHSGALTIESSVGVGTTVFIGLPIAGATAPLDD